MADKVKSVEKLSYYYNSEDTFPEWEESGQRAGDIVVYEDGWFEGITKDHYTDGAEGERFIFGVYIKNKLVDAIVLSKKGSVPDYGLPLRFELDFKKTDLENSDLLYAYMGSFISLSDSFKEANAKGKVILSSHQKGMDEKDTLGLQIKIKKYKEKMGTQNLKMYNAAFKERAQIVENCIRDAKNHYAFPGTAEERFQPVEAGKALGS